MMGGRCGQSPPPPPGGCWLTLLGAGTGTGTASAAGCNVGEKCHNSSVEDGTVKVVDIFGN